MSNRNVTKVCLLLCRPLSHVSLKSKSMSKQDLGCVYMYMWLFRLKIKASFSTWFDSGSRQFHCDIVHYLVKKKTLYWYLGADNIILSVLGLLHSKILFLEHCFSLQNHCIEFSKMNTNINFIEFNFNYTTLQQY